MVEKKLENGDKQEEGRKRGYGEWGGQKGGRVGGREGKVERSLSSQFREDPFDAFIVTLLDFSVVSSYMPTYFQIYNLRTYDIAFYIFCSLLLLYVVSCLL